MGLFTDTASIETVQFLNEEGELSPECQRLPPDDLLIKGYETMLLTRHIDERMVILQRQGAISFALSSFGEEACSVASSAALETSDWLYPQYRESGAIFWRGFTPKQYIHHMFCNGQDIILGRQMPNHFGSRKLNVVHVSSPIGTKIPHAAGAAYAMKLRKEPSIALCYFGEGATSEGDFHVGLNFAAVRKTPTIFFCRNNGYAISTPCEKQFASDGIAPKGVGYGIATIRVDGNDFIAVYHAVSKAKRICLEGNGPVLIEAMTYRLGAHSTSDDPSVYRSSEEVEANKKKDPILRLRKFLEAKGLWSAEKEEQKLKEVQTQVTEAIEEAKKALPPPFESLIDYVYFEPTPLLQEQFNDLKRSLCQS